MNTNEAGGAHYGKGLQPWDLQKSMISSGNAFVDARRADAIKYSFRIKGDETKQLDDLKKARHCLDEAIKYIEDITAKATYCEAEKTICPINHTLDNLNLEANGKCSICGELWPSDKYYNRIKKHLGDNLVMFHPTHNVSSDTNKCLNCGKTGNALTLSCTNPDTE
jgi:hypothetical protein